MSEIHPASTSSHRLVLASQGFTLLELVIVLAISGLIFGGLWGLLGSGNTQLQAQSTAQQYSQIITAVKKYIAANSKNAPLDALPLSGTTVLALSTLTTGGQYLPTNFANGGTTDNLGHTINIVIENVDANTALPGTPGGSFRFMVCSSGGTALSDKMGAQISSLIGAEGGFIYKADTPGCATGAADSTTTCGSYNSFNFAIPATYAPCNAVGSGQVATLSYSNDGSGLGSDWLARTGNYIQDFYTMSRNMFFEQGGGLTLFMQGNAINMSNAAGTKTGGGALTMNGGNLSMLGSTADVGGASVLTMNGASLWMGANAGTTGGGALHMATGTIDGLSTMTGDNGGTTLTSTALTLKSTGNYLLYVEGQNAGASLNIESNHAGFNDTTNTDILLVVYGSARFNQAQALQFIYTSDRSLKKNIRPIENPLDRVLQLKGYNFEMIKDNSTSIGFVAQDVQKVFPEVVMPIADGKLGVDYGKLIAPVVEAVRELKKENEALKSEIDAIKAAQKEPNKNNPTAAKPVAP